MKKVVGFGDFIVRLSPPGYERFIQASSFNINYTGAEANVLVSLAQMGVPTEFVTRLPNNAIAKAALSMLNKYGVHTDKVAFGGERMGLFYCEKGASQRPSKIVYDRKFTSICEAKYEDFDWDAIFDGASNFHITGITPATAFVRSSSSSSERCARPPGLRRTASYPYALVISASRQACSASPHTPATFTMVLPVFCSYRAISSATTRSTGSYSPISGFRMANWVECTAVAIPPTPQCR